MVSPPESASTTTNPPSPANLGAAERNEREKVTMHRTKLVQFLGLTTPIFLQNNNGPCPLLAICNVLSLRNGLNLAPNIQEVSQEKLLSCVAESLMDSNSSPDDKHGALDLLDRLTTGIDVNIRFRRIDDFEFTSESNIFALLDIPLYHGWIVDPQDNETVDAIGSKSYNTLMEELVALKSIEIEQKKNLIGDDDNVDHSFNIPPHRPGKGDLEEQADFLRALKLSAPESCTSLADDAVADVSNSDDAVADVSNSEHLEPVEDDVSTEETVENGTSDSESCSSQIYCIDEPEALSSTSDVSEPVYEGEECLSVKQGEIISKFVDNNASQLTEYGLSCLKENVKESEICVFFRNNHFNTMFKYEGELYILVTDQGYIHHPDLVWEKLNEVNGDNEYMTGNFEKFKMDDQKAIVDTEDYLAANSDDEDSSSDDFDLRFAKLFTRWN